MKKERIKRYASSRQDMRTSWPAFVTLYEQRHSYLHPVLHGSQTTFYQKIRSNDRNKPYQGNKKNLFPIESHNPLLQLLTVTNLSKWNLSCPSLSVQFWCFFLLLLLLGLRREVFYTNKIANSADNLTKETV